MKYHIHPPIGIARVGSSATEFFIGPERPGANGTELVQGVEVPLTRYKDTAWDMKRQMSLSICSSVAVWKPELPVSGATRDGALISNVIEPVALLKRPKISLSEKLADEMAQPIWPATKAFRKPWSVE